MKRVKKMLYTPEPALKRLMELAKKELKQQIEAGVPPMNKQRCRNQAIVNYSEGCVNLEGCHHHFMNMCGDYGLTGEEAALLNTITAKYADYYDRK